MSQQSALPPRVLLVLGLAVLLNYVDRGNLSTAAPVLQAELALTSSQMGLLMASFFWVYAPAQILAGWLVHRFDIRIVLGAGVFLWALATAFTGLAGSFATILVLRLLLGLGESVTFPAWQLILARNSTESERGRANGFVSSGQGVGPMLGTLFGGLAMAHFGWRPMFAGLGILTLLWLWPWFLVSRRRDFGAHVPDAAAPSVSYRDILARREFWGAALGHFAVNYTFYFVITWLPTYLVKVGGFTVPEMARIAAAIYGIYALSTAAAGVLSDRWIRSGASPTRVRKTFMIVSCLGAAVSIAAGGYADPRQTVWLLGAAGFGFGLSTPMIFAIAATLAGPRAAGRWAGAQNLAGQLAGTLAPLVTGIIVDRTGSFSGAFTIAAGSALLAAVGWGLVIRKVEPLRWHQHSANPSPGLAA